MLLAFPRQSPNNIASYKAESVASGKRTFSPDISYEVCSSCSESLYLAGCCRGKKCSSNG